VKVLFDTCVPRPLRQRLGGVEVVTAQEAGWGALKNGDLLRAARRPFDVLVTTDQNLKYQQNLEDKNVAIIVSPTNLLPKVLRLADKVIAALSKIQPGSFGEIEES
jgi:hypothetical protein